MMDLQHRLDEIAGPARPPTAAQLDADLARGRQSLRRRRTAQTLAGSAFAVAAAVAAFSFTATGPGGPPTSTTPSVASAVQLVAYKGEQPKGFTVDKVPDGWFVQGRESFELVIAPKAVQNPGPDVDPSKDPIYDPRDYRGKIAVFLQSKDESGPRDGKEVRVGDKDGVLVKSLPAQVPGEPSADPAADSGYSLWVKQPSGVHLIIQFWEGVGLSESQMLELGAGVHVHSDAVQGVG
jgi:hypothetical protein